MAKKEANYGMDGVHSYDQTHRTSPASGTYPLGKGGTNMDGIESVETSVGLHYQADELFDESFGPPVPLDAVTGIPGHARKPYYVGTGSEEQTGTVTGTLKDQGFDDFSE